MRSQVYPTRKKEYTHPVGGGIYEQMLLERQILDNSAALLLGREDLVGIGHDGFREESRGESGDGLPIGHPVRSDQLLQIL